jgi:thiol-disulfide isomerase/thioredoxin
VESSGVELAKQLAVPLLALLACAGVAWWFQRYRAVRSANVLWKVVAAGLVAGRVVFVLQNRDTYAASPWTILDPTDGGFAAMAALFAGFVSGVELTRRRPGARWPVFIAVLAGTVTWTVAAIATLDFAPARTLVPMAEVHRLDGTPVQLRTFTTKPLVVNLWATWCPPCQREMPLLRAAQQRYPGIAFVFVNQGEGSREIARFLARERLDLDNVFLDRAGVMGSRTGAFAFPTTLFYDREGRLFMRQVGELHGDTLDQRLQMLLQAH